MTVFLIAVFFFALILTGIRGYRDRMWSTAERSDRQYKDCYRIGQMCHNYLFFIRETFPILSQIENLRADKKKNRSEIQNLEDQYISARSQAFNKSLTVS